MTQQYLKFNFQHPYKYKEKDSSRSTAPSKSFEWWPGHITAGTGQQKKYPQKQQLPSKHNICLNKQGKKGGR